MNRILPVFLIVCVLSFSKAGFSVQIRGTEPDTPSLIHDGIEYSAEVPGVVLAREVKTGKKLWTKKIYDWEYAGKFEPEHEMVYILKMEIQGRNLIINNQCGGRFVLDLQTLQLQTVQGYSSGVKLFDPITCPEVKLIGSRPTNKHGT